MASTFLHIRYLTPLFPLLCTSFSFYNFLHSSFPFYSLHLIYFPINLFLFFIFIIMIFYLLLLIHLVHTDLVTTYLIAKYPQSLLQHSDLFLRGDSCSLSSQKGVKMRNNESNVWVLSVLCPTYQNIKVKVYVNDSVAMIGIQNFEVIKNREVVIFPSFYPQKSKIVNSQPIYSEILKNQRKLSYYFPPSFYENNLKKYQLLLMQDGQNLFNVEDSQFGKIWNIKPTLDNFILNGSIEEIIVVGIWNTPDRCNQYTNTYDPEEQCGGKADLYLDFIEKELLPFFLSDFSSRIDEKQKISIGGGSYGGLLSCYGLFKKFDLYKQGICMSSSFWWDNQNFLNKVLPSLPYQSQMKVYLDSGDDNKEQTLNVKNYLLKVGFKQGKNLFYYYDKGGVHDVTVLGKRFDIPLLRLYGLNEEENKSNNLEQ